MNSFHLSKRTRPQDVCALKHDDHPSIMVPVVTTRTWMAKRERGANIFQHRAENPIPHYWKK
jgi:hypothetical protein